MSEVPAETKEPYLLLPGLTKFSLSELEAATDGFSVGNIIGRGGFGSTAFKGVLRGELLVAIKKFREPNKSLIVRICNELHVNSELQRKKMENNNIVKILGCGHEVIQKHEPLPPHVFIVEEYMANGNMDNFIYEARYGWSCRFQIIQGIANGMNYLHDEQILHLDLKPSNILLDSDMNPKITGLGRARKLNETTTHDDSMAGTVGYMPPEYILDGTLSKKYDIYAFGAILLETLSGMCRSEPPRHQASVQWAWESRNSGQMNELLDPSLCDASQLTEVGWCMEVGLLCTQENQEDRPTMLDVIRMLNKEKELMNPTRPEYTTKRRSRATP